MQQIRESSAPRGPGRVPEPPSPYAGNALFTTGAVRRETLPVAARIARIRCDTALLAAISSRAGSVKAPARRRRGLPSPCGDYAPFPISSSTGAKRSITAVEIPSRLTCTWEMPSPRYAFSSSAISAASPINGSRGL